MSTTVIDHPLRSEVHPGLGVKFAQLSALSRPGVAGFERDTEAIVDAVQRQTAAASAAARRVTDEERGAVDPQAWLFAERTRYREQGTCDPYAMLMLMRAGLLPVS